MLENNADILKYPPAFRRSELVNYQVKINDDLIS
jgi:hypothetical protein